MTTAKVTWVAYSGGTSFREVRMRLSSNADVREGRRINLSGTQLNKPDYCLVAFRWPAPVDLSDYAPENLTFQCWQPLQSTRSGRRTYVAVMSRGVYNVSTSRRCVLDMVLPEEGDPLVDG